MSGDLRSHLAGMVSKGCCSNPEINGRINVVSFGLSWTLLHVPALAGKRYKMRVNLFAAGFLLARMASNCLFIQKKFG